MGRVGRVYCFGCGWVRLGDGKDGRNYVCVCVCDGPSVGVCGV